MSKSLCWLMLLRLFVSCLVFAVCYAFVFGVVRISMIPPAQKEYTNLLLCGFLRVLLF